jgi:hypothetical protein
MITLLILYLIFGTLLVILSIPLLQNKIKPNGLYGFRVKTTLDDPKMWYAVNNHFARRLLVIGLAIILSSILLYFVPGITLDQYAIGVLITLVLFFGVGLIQSIRYMNRLK